MPDGDAERVAALHLIEATGQSVRKRIEEAFGWIKTIAGQEKDQVPRTGSCRMAIYLRGRSLQSGSVIQTAVATGVTAAAVANSLVEAGSLRSIAGTATISITSGSLSAKPNENPSSTAC